MLVIFCFNPSCFAKCYCIIFLKNADWFVNLGTGAEHIQAHQIRLVRDNLNVRFVVFIFIRKAYWETFHFVVLL